jgi:hypothetical protein
MMNLLAIAVFPLMVAPGSGQDVHLYGYTGNTVSTVIPHEKLAKSPSWKMQSDTPPLPAGKAIRLANLARAKLVKDSKRCRWVLATAAVEWLDPWRWAADPLMREKCWWSVRYEYRVREGGQTGVGYIYIVVLMDGTVIVPKASEIQTEPE